MEHKMITDMNLPNWIKVTYQIKEKTPKYTPWFHQQLLAGKISEEELMDGVDVTVSEIRKACKDYLR